MTRTPDAWEIVAAPINYIRAPRRSISLRAGMILAGIIASAIGALIAALQIYEVMP